MAKYAFQGGYTTETWARFVQNPGDRSAPVRQAVEAAGGKLEKLYWSFGEDDFLVILDCPNDIAAAAIAVAVGSSGALRNTRTTKLIEADELSQILEKAKAVAGAYVPPGAREPVRA
ncbi:MAG: GYD domain-containing protein [Chloroflexi bacterium]|nr:MAG: GYD domain-containing protein [Chloroflexota bacterium]TME17865.1 MAG: GYD domain-containing protein [Chloroflexota bacterium]TME19681.1 MAG: GYD domain-containing protein [Chloroflexota bacterium]